jgi:3'-phosphoadenosine 5'-phosphosulfate (PAPS) 3'-phosphatase
MTSSPDLGALVAPLIDLARAAGKAALVHYGPGAAARAKRDGSPVTDADEASEAVILAGLARLTPGIPVVSEEQIAAGHTPFPPGEVPRRFWLVDPLDGTKEFVARNGEFAVNIGLVEDFYPVFGLLHGPVLDDVWCSDGLGAAFRTRGDGPRAPLIASTRSSRITPSRNVASSAALSNSPCSPPARQTSIRASDQPANGTVALARPSSNRPAAAS